MARILGIHPEVLIGEGEVVVEVSHDHVGTWALEMTLLLCWLNEELTVHRVQPPLSSLRSSALPARTSGPRASPERFGDGEYQAGASVAADSAGAVPLLGNFQGSIDLGGATLMSVSAQDLFLGEARRSRQARLEQELRRHRHPVRDERRGGRRRRPDGHRLRRHDRLRRWPADDHGERRCLLGRVERRRRPRVEQELRRDGAIARGRRCR